MDLTHRRIETAGAPQAIGPYSQGVAIPELGLVFTSGQIGLDPGTGELVAGGIEAQARRVLQNVEAILEAAGSGMDRIVRSTLYLVDMADFGLVNSLYAEKVGAPLPARSTIAAAALPKGARIELDVIASVRPRSS
ncbi:MAG: Rid family detoxifying hydrolase [Candidatus Eisenbacteria bacterium]